MKKFWSPLIILIVIPLFIFVSLVCCCFESTAEASELAPSCHSMVNSPEDSSASQSGDDCECTYKDNFLTQKSFSIDQPAATIFTDLKNISMPNGIVSEIFQNPILIVTTQGPPKASAYSLPLYIQNSNFRL